MSYTSWKGYETIRVSHFRSGILSIDGNQYEIVFNDDGQFQDVYNKNRQCIADPCGVLTEWSWEEEPKREYRFMKKIEEVPE